MLLKQKFNLLILVTAIVSAGLAYVSSVWILQTQVIGSLDAQKEAITSSIQRDVEVFDSILLLIEEQWDAELANALPQAALLLESSDITNTEAFTQQLLDIREQFNLSDLHIIDRDLIVVQSTFADEVGLDIGGYSDEYTMLVRRVLEQSTYVTHRVSLSTMTGSLKKYAYYHRPGTDFIVNGDIDVKDRLSIGINNKIGEFLFGDYKDKLVGKYELIDDIDLFLVSRGDHWSFFNEGKQIESALAKKLYQTGDPYTEQYTHIAQVQMQNYDELGFKVFLKIDYNLDLVQEAKYQLKLTALSIALLVIVSTFILFHFGAKRAVVTRFDALLKQIKEKEKTGEKEIHLPGNDELVELSNAINAMMTKIESEQTKNKHLSNMFNTDGLTNIANRRCFDERFEIEWARAVRESSDLSLLMIDVDFFKEYNDLYGHIAGDNTLIAIANTLVDTLARPSDFTARYGGEEFICLLPNTDRQGALTIAEHIREAVIASNITHEKSDVSNVVTVSIGCFTVNGSSKMASTDVLKQTDDLLYQSKREGRNRTTANAAP
ncbi:GGDEF domain-containing protein [Glaciecola sp. XM2]|uniref:diguanylate cyclase n=1 Tax=Glaciecola sp. XM2 TaxID=1914931 RepID=UPI001BDED224|nr:diguanylate cyclase [Glaciecola sp. XM2]MBT1450995.1 GGDEF domain-containing protein [Glaciecola sp. XM2]